MMCVHLCDLLDVLDLVDEFHLCHPLVVLGWGKHLGRETTTFAFPSAREGARAHFKFEI